MNLKNLSPNQLLVLKNKAEAEICKRDMYEFVKRAWHVVEPSEKYMDNWRIEAICRHLEACTRGEIRNLIINIPPRHMKSLLVNVFFPAWVWTFAPEKKFLFTSYGEDLAIRDSLRCKKLITSQWYQDRFEVELVKDNNQKSQFENTAGGYRLSFGFGGGITGQGGDFICVDDPLKASDAFSEAIRNQCNYIYDSTISTRLNNPQTGVKIIIMQRLHEDDLTGHLLRGKEKYETLILPAEYEGIRFQSSIGFKDPRTKEGELLWESRFSREELEKIKASLSDYGVASQLQQRPSPISGYIFKKEWFINRYSPTDFVARFISWDTASTTAEYSAYSAGIVGELLPDYRLFIRDVFREKLEFPQLTEAVEELANKYKHKLHAVLIENKSSGISLVQTLSQTSEDWLKDLIVPVKPSSDKIARAQNASIWCSNGSVLLPPIGKLFDFEDELFTFPSSKHADQVDAFTQLIYYLENYLAEGLRERK